MYYPTSNPMLGETFEDSRMKFIAEKVLHNPFVMAYHAEGDGWELSATSSGKTKFWGALSSYCHPAPGALTRFLASLVAKRQELGNHPTRHNTRTNWDRSLRMVKALWSHASTLV
jgi:hypothetical protein